MSEQKKAQARSPRHPPPEKGNAAPGANRNGANHLGKKQRASEDQDYNPVSKASTADRHDPALKRAKHHEIAVRYAWDARARKRRGRVGVVGRVRMRELERVLAYRYGETLPDDDAGRDDLLLAAMHIAATFKNPAEHIPEWAALWAPWLSQTECDDLIARVTAKSFTLRADTIAWRLGLTMAERAMLKITTIGAIDCNKEARLQRRQDQKNAGKQARRRKAGAVSRTEYESQSAARTKPWEAMGMSRRTWYAKGKPMPTETPVAQPEAKANTSAQVRGQQMKEYSLGPHLCSQPQASVSKAKKVTLERIGQMMGARVGRAPPTGPCYKSSVTPCNTCVRGAS